MLTNYRREDKETRVCDIRKWIDLVEGRDNDEHTTQLRKTGFWGAAGAGAIFLAKETGRFMLMHRATTIPNRGPLEGDTYGTAGGAIDRGEDPTDAVRREIFEETRYSGSLELIPLLVFKKQNFQYFNFLAIIEREFSPQLDWESQGWKWFEFGDFPQPLHFGVISLLNDPNSVRIMKKYAAIYYANKINNNKQ